jgi:hypothetical protein
MKVGADHRTGLDGFSRLDWPASEFLSHAGTARRRTSDEVAQLNWAASEILREARRARAEAVRRWCRSLLHELKQLVSGGLSVLAQARLPAAGASRRP